MRKLLLAFAIALPLSAQITTTTYVGTVKDLTGTTITSGRITWQLNAPTAPVIPGKGAFVSTIVSCLIDANGLPVSTTDGVSPCVVTNNTALTPTGTSYRMCYQPYNITPGSCINTFANGGTVDVSTIIPTPSTSPNYGVTITNAAQGIQHAVQYNNLGAISGSLATLDGSGNFATSGTVAAGAIHPATVPVYDVMSPTYGAKGDGSTDDTTAIAAAATACNAATNGGILYFPRTTGAFTTTQTVTVYGSCDLAVDGTLRATASMTALVQGGNSSNSYSRRRMYGSGIVDLNGLATIGVWLYRYGHVEVTGLTIYNSGSHAGIDIGSSGAAIQYEAFIHDLTLYVPGGVNTHGTGNVGIFNEYGSDSQIGPNIAVVGWDIGVRSNTSGNQAFSGIHCWGASGSGWSNLPTECFHSSGGNIWLNDEADTPTAYGFRSTGFNDEVSHFRCYNNTTWGTDNALICTQFDQTGPFSSVSYSHFQGGDASHRIAQDVSVSGGSYSSMTMVGNEIIGNVVTLKSPNTNFRNLNLQNTLTMVAGSQTLTSATSGLTWNQPTNNTFTMTFNAGLSLTQAESLRFQDQGANEWYITKDASNNFQIFDNVGNINRISMTQNGAMAFRNNEANPFTFLNGADATLSLILNSGSTTTQGTSLAFQDQGANKWYMTKDSSNNFQLFDNTASLNRLNFTLNGATTFNNPAAAGYTFNIGGTSAFQISASGPTVNSKALCLADGTNCQAHTYFLTIANSGAVATTGTSQTGPALTQAITVDSVSLWANTAPLTCATYPVVNVWDVTAGSSIANVTMASATNGYTMTVTSAAVPSTHQIGMRVSTAPVTCGTNASAISMYVQYH